MAFVSGLDRLVEAVEAAEAAAAAKRSPRQVAGGFECPHPDCRRVFSKRYNQQAHMRLHDGTRPFSCDLCGKAFRWKSSLKSHTKMHAKISAAEMNGERSSSRSNAKQTVIPNRVTSRLSGSNTSKVTAGVAKGRSKSSSPARKKIGSSKKRGMVKVETSIVQPKVVMAVPGVPLQIPSLSRRLSEKNAAGRKSPDSISMVDHAAATVLTMFR